MGDVFIYEQPTNYIVKTTKYSNMYKTPVLTAGKTFILGYTNEQENLFTNFPCIIFDDFTTATKFVNFPFKVKSSAMKILTHSNEDDNIKYLYYLLQTIKIDNQTHKRFWISEYANIEVNIPNKTEQNRIVEKLDELFSELDNGIAELKQAKERLKVYRQAVLKEAFEGKFYCSVRKNIKEKYIVDNIVTLDSLPPIPDEWQYIALGKLGDLSRGKSKHRPRNDEKLFDNGIYPFIQTGEVKASNIIRSSNSFYNEFGLKQSKLWKKGTLCITIAANIAETSFLGIDACFPDSIVGFLPFENLVLSKYVKYFIESSKARISAFAPATAQKNINLTTMENLFIPYCTLPEQQKIVEEIESRLSICDEAEKTVAEQLAKAELLRQSILKKAFEGDL